MKPSFPIHSSVHPLFRSLQPRYDKLEAAAAMKEILEKYSPACTVEFHPYFVEIVDSYLVKHREDRLKICEIMVRSGVTPRTAKNLSAEWLVHNLSYQLHVLRWAAKDVSLDYVRDERFPVRWATWIFEHLNLL